MSLPTSEPIPDDSTNLPPARRRRERRHLASHLQGDVSQRAAFLDELAAHSIPSFDFFLFSLLSGLVFGLGFLFNSPAVTVLAAVISPFLSPLIGISLATIVGSGRFFLKSLVCVLTGSALAFLGGLLASYALPLFPSLDLNTAWVVSQSALTWPSLAALTLVTIMGVVFYVQDQRKELLSPQAFIPLAGRRIAAIPGVGLAYLIYLPLAAAGFGLHLGVSAIWPLGLITFIVHLAFAAFVGILTLAVLGLRPLTMFGYTLGTTITLSVLVLMLGFGGIGTFLRAQPSIPVILPTPVTPSPTQPTSTWTPVPATSTRTLSPSSTNTLIPSPTFTITLTPVPTPVWAMIYAQSLNGAYIREEPRVGGKILTSILNGTLVKVLPEVIQEGGTIWAHIETNDGIVGWIVQSLLVTATPVPAW